MEYRRLGKSGLQVSALSFGSWLTFGKQIGDETAENLMKTAYDNGINFFDNAEQYAGGKSEEVMGKILDKMKWRRDTYVVSSKVFWGGTLPNQKGLSRKHVIEACHAALKRLRVDYLDLYFCHRPDLNTPVEETVRAMTELIWQGKVLYWGTSEWSAQEIMEAYSVARQYNLIPPTMEQPQYNMFVRDRVEKEYHKLYDVIGLGTTTWSPLASGLLTGKYNNGTVPQDSRAALAKEQSQELGWLYDRLTGEQAKDKMLKAEQIGKIAQDLGVSTAVFAIAWCLRKNYVSTVILGASKIQQLQENLTALEVVPKITSEIEEKVEAILQNQPVILRF
jgi:voltage-dependent potassium channel beta subunit